MKLAIVLWVLVGLSSCSQSNSKEKTSESRNEKGLQIEKKNELRPTRLQNSDSIISGLLNSFIPDGFSILDTSSGDLNKDAYSDMVLVLKRDGEESLSDVIENPEARPLLLLLGKADTPYYSLAARNDSVVFCYDCGGAMGDPFQGVVVKNGIFSVEHYGGSAWRWTRIITFKYSPKDSIWLLFRDGGDSFHAAEPEKVKTMVQTPKEFGKVLFEKFSVYQ
jgi:hypothetical protein